MALKARLDAETKVIDFDQAQSIVGGLVTQYPDNERLPIIAAMLEWRSGKQEAGIQQLRQIAEAHPEDPHVHEVLAGLLPSSPENNQEIWDLYQVAMRSGPLNLLCQKVRAYYFGKRVDPDHAAAALVETSWIERAVIRTRVGGLTRLALVYVVAGVVAIALRLYGEEFAAAVVICMFSVGVGWMVFANELACCRKCRNAWIGLTAFAWIVYLFSPHLRRWAIPLGIESAVLFLILGVADVLRRKEGFRKILFKFSILEVSLGILVLAAVNSQLGRYPGTTVFTIPVKGEITAMAVSPNGKLAYLSGTNMSSIYLVDIASHTLAQVQIHPGANVTGVAVTPDGRELYVTSNGSNAAGIRRTLYVVNTTTNRVTGAINVGGSSSFVAFSPDGRTAFVGVDNGLDFVDVQLQKVTTQIPIQQGASLIAVNPNGQSVYVVSDLLQVINVKQRKVVATLGASNSGACGLALNPQGTTLYESFCSTVGSSIRAVEPMQVIDTTTNSVTSQIPISGGSRGIAVSPSGNVVFTASDVRYGIDAFDARKHSLIGVIPVATGSKYSILNLVNIDSSGREMYTATYNFFRTASQFTLIFLPSK